MNWKGFGRKRLWHIWHSFFAFPWRNREHWHVSQRTAVGLWKGWYLVRLSLFSPAHQDWLLRPTQPPIQWMRRSFPWAKRRDGKSTTDFHLMRRISGATFFFTLDAALFIIFFFFTLDAGLLARSQYSEGPATGHLDTGFSWFPCVYKQMLRWFPRLQVATTCFSCSSPDLNLVATNFMFCIHVK